MIPAFPRSRRRFALWGDLSLAMFVLSITPASACLAQKENAKPEIEKNPPIRLGEAFTYKTVARTAVATAGEKSNASQVVQTDGIRELTVYCTKPTGWSPEDKRPAIVFFHGGGWVGGAPGQFSEHARYFASRGLVCFQVQYRLLDRKSNDPPTECIEDALDAMRWVRGNAARFGIDAARIASAGGSAGGHLAAYLGCIAQPANKSEEEAISAKSDAMLLFNPVYDNGPGGWGAKRVGEQYTRFSPAHNITPDDPPNIVFFGSRDNLVPVETAKRFREQCTSHGVNSELVVYEGEGHGFFNVNKKEGRYYLKTVEASDRFLVTLGWLEGEPSVKLPVLAD